VLRAHILEIVVTHPLVPDDNLDLYWKFGRLFGRITDAAALEAACTSARDDPADSTRNVRSLRLYAAKRAGDNQTA
jgi:hypothetical protein